MKIKEKAGQECSKHPEGNDPFVLIEAHQHQNPTEGKQGKVKRSHVLALLDRWGCHGQNRQKRDGNGKDKEQKYFAESAAHAKKGDYDEDKKENNHCFVSKLVCGY